MLYLIRIELEMKEDREEHVVKNLYTALHARMAAKKISRLVESRVDGEIYHLPDATYIGDLSTNADIALKAVRDAAGAPPPIHDYRIIIAACAEIRSSNLRLADRAIDRVNWMTSGRIVI